MSTAERRVPALLRSASVRASKLEPARLRAGAIQRERLLGQLAAAADTPIVLISASAGYGKSTLAAQWSARCQRPVAWINLDRGDDDPLMFLNVVTHALDRLDPVAPELLDEFAARAPHVVDVVLPCLAAELERLSPLELIFDDLQEVTQTRTLSALNFLLDVVGPGSQVVLATRTDTDLWLARQRLSGDLFEIRADQLALDADEALALAESTGANLSEPALGLLCERTEGWPAGIALALHALHEPVSAEDIAQAITGDQREIADYLVEVMLDREPQERRRFLLATSVLTQMTAPLCDAVLGIDNSSEVLEDLERTNSFVIALDDQRRWYRYHTLFAELLRSELDRSDPELAAEYLARAAQWHEQDGADPGEAFRCAHECGDLELAGRIALASTDGFARFGQLETLRMWLLNCTDAEIASDSQLALAAAWVYMLLGQPDEAQKFARAAEDGDLDVPGADGATSLRSSLANFRSALAPAGIHQMLVDAEFVRAAEPDSRTRWLFGGFLRTGIAELLLGRSGEAVATFREGLGLTTGHPELPHVKILCLGYLAFALAETGNEPAARKSAQEAWAISVGERLDRSLPGGVALTARAMALAHDGDFDRATLQLRDARRTSHLFRGARWINADMNIRWGNISLDLGDRPGAQEHAETARAALHGYPDPGMLPSRLAQLDERLAVPAELTPAEMRILPFLPTHLSVKEVAERLDVSPATVKTHVSSVYAKLGAASRSDAVEKMQRLGLRFDPAGRRRSSPPESNNGRT